MMYWVRMVSFVIMLVGGVGLKQLDMALMTLAYDMVPLWKTRAPKNQVALSYGAPIGSFDIVVDVVRIL